MTCRIHEKCPFSSKAFESNTLDRVEEIGSEINRVNSRAFASNPSPKTNVLQKKLEYFQRKYVLEYQAHQETCKINNPEMFNGRANPHYFPGNPL